MDVNINFLHVINPFGYLFISFQSRSSLTAPQKSTDFSGTPQAPSKKPKNLLKNHLTTFAKSNDLFGLNFEETIE